MTVTQTVDGAGEAVHSSFRLALDRRFIALVCATAVPVTLQSLMSSSRTIVDALFVSHLGTDEIAAIGYSTRVIFIVLMAMLGTANGGAVIVAQFWGSGSARKARQATTLTVVIAGAIAVVVCTACFVWATEIMAVGTENSRVISLGTEYIRTVIPMIIPFAVISVLAASLRSLGQAKTAMNLALIGLFLHVALAYGLVFGNWGMPELRLAGAAWATVISTYAEFLLFIVYLYGRRHPMAFRIRDLREGVGNGILQKIWRVGLPVSLGSMSWAIGIFCYSAIVGRAGTQELAVLSMINPIEDTAVCFANGVATAAAVLIGNRIGEGADEERTWCMSKALLIWSAAVAAVCSLLLLLTSFWVGKIYGEIDGETIGVARDTAAVLAFVFIFRMTCMTLQNGLLRAGGDTVYILRADLGCQWLIAIPLTFMAALVWDLPFPLVFVAINSEEIVKAVISGYRVYRRKWVKRLVETATS
ncbi:MATE family efflux transporter [Streptomyces purpurascens]|uniref:MATE family efflux transporter n=1 Tax=Streptomyces purpurascens TaxID=1924 RepID=UPI003C2C0FB1